MNAKLNTSVRFEQADKKFTLLHTSQWLPAPLGEVFGFFSRPENLKRLTPSRLEFNILTPSPIEMREGLKLDYKLKVHGIPLFWSSLISVYDPPHCFTDEQLKGPYKTWIHTHRFVEVGVGTRVEDLIRFRAPGGRLIEKLIVQRDLAAIFNHRHQVLKKLYPPPNSSC